MATINFLYRSTREQAPIYLRLLYSYEGKNYVIEGKTQKIVTKDYWENDHFKQRINDIDRSNYRNDVKDDLNKIESFIMDSFVKVEDPTTINKDWLKTQITNFYDPPQEKAQAPEHLTDFFLFYSDIKKNDLTATRLRRLTVVRNKLLRFEDYKSKKYLISEIDDNFKKDFLDFIQKNKYAETTTKTDFSVIKTVCFYAREWNIKTSPQLRNLKIKESKTKNIYLSFDELEQIKALNLPTGGYLDNARDWLIISCYTGQRSSDFLRFVPEMVTKVKNEYFLEFTQRKTGKKMIIPFLDEAKAIFDKHNGNFPRVISKPKYNDYIKEVCKRAGINEPTQGKVIVCIADDPTKATKNDYRRELKTVPKYKLVSTHIGRRSFATNYYGKVPTNYLIQITGHSTEKMFLAYIQKTERQTAYDSFKYFK